MIPVIQVILLAALWVAACFVYGSVQKPMRFNAGQKQRCDNVRVELGTASLEAGKASVNVFEAKKVGSLTETHQ